MNGSSLIWREWRAASKNVPPQDAVVLLLACTVSARVQGTIAAPYYQKPAYSGLAADIRAGSCGETSKGPAANLVWVRPLRRTKVP